MKMRKLLFIVPVLLLLAGGCSSTKHQSRKKMKSYNKQLNDHPDRNKAQMKHMKNH
jgi:uncharacterized protein YneF (UPF0154 family)